MKGVPVRFEIGPRDIENGVVTYCRRDTLSKESMSMDGIVAATTQLLDEIQQHMYAKSLAFRDSHVRECHNMAEVAEALDNKCFAKIVWDRNPADEAMLKEKLQATVRVMLEEEKPFQTTCTICGKECEEPTVTLVARAY